MPFMESIHQEKNNAKITGRFERLFRFYKLKYEKDELAFSTKIDNLRGSLERLEKKTLDSNNNHSFNQKLQSLEKMHSEDFDELKGILSKILDINIVMGYELSDLKKENESLRKLIDDFSSFKPEYEKILLDLKIVLNKERDDKRELEGKINELDEKIEFNDIQKTVDKLEENHNLRSMKVDFLDLSPQLQEIILNSPENHKFYYEEFQAKFNLSNANARKILSVLRNSGWILEESTKRPKYFILKTKASN